MQKCTVLAAGLALFSTGCHLKPKDLLKALDVSKPATITVTVSPASPSLPVNGTQQFTTVVTGTSDTQVTWSLGGALCTEDKIAARSAPVVFTLLQELFPIPI